MKIEHHQLDLAIQKPSPNKGRALNQPQFIVAHYTGGRSAKSSAEWLCNPAAKASAHLVIGRSGELYQLVDFNRVAWHAGASTWGKLSGLNNYSIGIELDNPGWLVSKGGKWHSLVLGTDYESKDVIIAAHKNGGGVKGWLTYSQAQIRLFQDISRELATVYPSIRDIIGHDDIAPSRKLDPGPALNLESVRSSVFGRQ